MSRQSLLFALLAAFGSASAQTGTGLGCKFSPQDARLELAVGAKPTQIEIRDRSAADPKPVVCLALMACTIKPNAVSIHWEYASGSAGGKGPQWHDIVRASIRYKDGSQENCPIQTAVDAALFAPRIIEPEIDPKLRDFQIPK